MIFHGRYYRARQIDCLAKNDILQAVPNGYPNPTRYPVFSSIPDPTRFNFENLRVAGNPKYRVLPEISGNTRSFGYYPIFRVANYLWITQNTRNYPEYPELPKSKKDTRKYPILFFNTPTRPEPDPLPSIFSYTRPDPILKNPTRWALPSVPHATPLMPGLNIISDKEAWWNQIQMVLNTLWIDLWRRRWKYIWEMIKSVPCSDMIVIIITNIPWDRNHW